MADGNVKEKALLKLQDDLKKNEKTLMISQCLMGFFTKRITESDSFAEDVNIEKKNLTNCEKYIFNRAKKNAGKNNKACFRDDVVFEWAEDYFHNEVKEDEPPKKYTVPEVKPMVIAAGTEEKPEVKNEEPKKKDTGQMSIFDYFGGIA